MSVVRIDADTGEQHARFFHHPGFDAACQCVHFLHGHRVGKLKVDRGEILARAEVINHEVIRPMYLRFLAEDLRDLIGNLGVFTFPEDWSFSVSTIIPIPALIMTSEITAPT